MDMLAATRPEPSKVCAAINADTRGALVTAARAYEERFGYPYVASRLFDPEGFEPRDILVDLGHRLDNDDRTERKVMRNELAKINHTRLDRLLGPEGGWPQY
ncbi:MAG: 2-oxo-4-hydroxy-4-carboxy-5-ureidoimidazoline decarboxylase [Mycobacterium sp.]|nr:2-oxo-4-hydroxy-4-carboxy-5-ureidoimidazoline decarboxylase [Mycobacterium sp.]